MSFIDSKYMEIADETNCLILLLGIFNLIFNIPNISTYFEGFLIGGGIYLFIAVLSNGSIGGGDIKLITICGLLLGSKGILCAAWIALLVASFYAVYIMTLEKSRKAEFALGPFICFGVLCVYLNIF
jgi:leader peptidase (prepilin peptidase)/N-methyltransferase